MIPPDAPSDAFLFGSSVEKQMTTTTTAMTFADLGLADEIVGVLSERGITAPFPVQELTIPDALAGRDVCGKARTGSGKTLAFGLPVLQRMQKAAPNHPTGLVLVPTRELANQVCDELAPAAIAVGRSALAIYGGAPIEKQIEKLATGVDLVVATPGRMIDLIERDAISVSQVQHVVVDEADRMADMGFHPYLDDDIQGCIITTYLFPDDKNFDFDVFYHSLSDKGIVYVCGDNMMTGWEAVLYCTVLCMLCVVEMTGWGASLLSPFTPM